MTIQLPENHTSETLFLVLMHEIQAKFANHAILKGGMVLRLLGSHRRTLDLDYTFVPFKSKNTILHDLKEICSSIEGAHISVSVNSKAIRILVKTNRAQAQIEANVSKQCKSIAMSTAELAKNVSMSARVIRVMSFDVSLANKLAAWVERRLVRDLYDVYYLCNAVGFEVDLETLKKRLGKIESRIPRFKQIKKMTMEDFLTLLRAAAKDLTEKDIRGELSGVIDENEIAGLDLRIRRTVFDLVASLESKGI